MSAFEHGEHALILLKQVLVLFHRVSQLADVIFKALHQFLLIGLQMLFGIFKLFHFAVEIGFHLLHKIRVNGFGDEPHRPRRKRTFAHTRSKITRNDDDGRIGQHFAQTSGRFTPRHVRQAAIQQDQAGMCLLG